ncbi:MAG: serine/threonine protein kinase [Planctomycetales bacterium]|nr:serine/threonine protein kinase [Planctomycetales bacterium]
MNESNDELDELIGELLSAEEQGQRIDVEQWASMHPRFADELREFWANHRLLSPPASEFDQPEEVGATLDLSPSLAGPALHRENSWSLAPSAAAGAMPKQLSRFELVEELGRGGMGVVYRGRDRSLGQNVAVKMLLSAANHDPHCVQRFYAEAQVAARLSHPNIVPVFEVGVDEERHYYAMALVEGRTLSTLLAEDGPLEPCAAAEFVRQAALAVHYAHQQGVVHRDIKPSNLMVDTGGQPKLMDFGLAKQDDAELGLTLTGQILGTLAFMSPEQAAGRNQQVGPASDVYGLGAVLYAALTGQPLFSGESQAELVVKVLTAEPPIPACPRHCSDLAKICLKCLEKQPERRYASAAELADDLNAFLRGEPVKAHTTWNKRVSKWVRRQPALAAHWAALGAIELFRHTKVFWGDEEPNDVRITGLLVVWAAAGLAVQQLERWRGEGARYLWVGLDLVLLTCVLALLEKPHGPLLATYPLTIVFCALLFRVRMVVATTCGAIVAYLTLIGLRPSDSPPHQHLLFVIILGLIGFVIGAHLRRLRLLDSVYRRRHE